MIVFIYTHLTNSYS